MPVAHDLVTKLTLALRLGCLNVARHGEFLLLEAQDRIFFGDVLGGNAHRHIGGGHGFRQSRIRHRVEAHHGNPAHAFNPGTDKNFAGTQSNGPRCRMNGLHGRAAKTVDGSGAHGLRQAGNEGNQPGHIEPLFAFGKGTAQQQVFHVFRIDPGHLHKPAHHPCRQIIRAGSGKRPLVGEMKR